MSCSSKMDVYLVYITVLVKSPVGFLLSMGSATSSALLAHQKNDRAGGSKSSTIKRSNSKRMMLTRIKERVRRAQSILDREGWDGGDDGGDVSRAE